jgi:hypothetical protein
VQYINIDGNGRIRYARVVRKNEPLERVDQDFPTLVPSAIIRLATIKELPEEKNAAYAICRMLQAVAFDKQFPLAFVTNPKTTLWQWHDETTGIDISQTEDNLYGVPLLFDEGIPAYVLILCAGYLRDSPLAETRRSLKITMPQYTLPPFAGENG